MKDQYGREIDYIRISVTDRCNLRCKYCIPECGIASVGHENILNFDEITRIVAEQELVIEAALERNLDKAFVAFMNNPLINLSKEDARALFDEMIENTKEYLKEYF